VQASRYQSKVSRRGAEAFSSTNSASETDQRGSSPGRRRIESETGRSVCASGGRSGFRSPPVSRPARGRRGRRRRSAAARRGRRSRGGSRAGAPREARCRGAARRPPPAGARPAAGDGEARTMSSCAWRGARAAARIVGKVDQPGDAGGKRSGARISETSSATTWKRRCPPSPRPSRARAAARRAGLGHGRRPARRVRDRRHRHRSVRPLGQASRRGGAVVANQ
jgi:hypothetical protein